MDTAHTKQLCREGDAHRPVTPPSFQTASQCEEADKEATTGGGQVDIYSNVDFPAGPQPEDLFYTSVSFTKEPPKRIDASITESYSIITYLPPNESTVYGNI